MATYLARAPLCEVYKGQRPEAAQQRAATERPAARLFNAHPLPGARKLRALRRIKCVHRPRFPRMLLRLLATLHNYFTYRDTFCESCSQFDLIPLLSHSHLISELDRPTYLVLATGTGEAATSLSRNSAPVEETESERVVRIHSLLAPPSLPKEHQRVFAAAQLRQFMAQSAVLTGMEVVAHTAAVSRAPVSEAGSR